MTILSHDTKKICRVSEVSKRFLKFTLTEEQKAKIPAGKKIVFRRCKQHVKGKSYSQFLSRAQYTSSVNSKHKGTIVTVGTSQLGVVWDDEPEWIYETDKSKSCIKARRIAATAERHRAHRMLASTIASIFAETVDYAENCVVVKRVPITLFLVVAVAGSLRGYTDATSVANYWNNNLPYLQKLYPHLELKELSHDSVTRLYQSLTEKSAKTMLRSFYEWVPKWFTEEELRHISIDGQVCCASNHYETGRRMMTLNAVDVTAGKLCIAHTQIDTKSNEPKFAPGLIDFLPSVSGATITFDALNTTRAIADHILSKKAFYLLAVKENQPKLYEAVRSTIAAAKAEKPEVRKDASELLQEIDSGKESMHNRVDTRGTIVVPANRLPKEILDEWPGLENGCIAEATTKSFRQDGNKEWSTSTETRWFISCHPYGNGEIAEWIASCIRGHWGVESFHWTMDMIFKQDYMECRYPAYLWTRQTIAKIAHNLLKTFQKIDQERRGLSQPRSETQLSHEVGADLKTALGWIWLAAQYKAAK